MTAMNTHWGKCLTCKWWQIEPEAAVANETLGQCIDESLQSFQLSVSGDGGCNKYVSGVPARGAGSGAQPPTAAPAR
jgi:hypothetical protein